MGADTSPWAAEVDTGKNNDVGTVLDKHSAGEDLGEHQDDLKTEEGGNVVEDKAEDNEDS